MDYIAVPESDALEQVWIGDRWPLNAGKFEMAGFENRLAETAEPDEEDAESVTITVVCNEAEMREEYDETLYGDRDELPFEVRSHFDVTVDELAAILSRRTDFLHYIGHIEGSEFVCSDGRLDVEDVDSVGARAFLLNGCKSMLQGPRMLEAGSVAGFVTLRDVGNRGAIDVGRQIAKLLNCGFSIGSALEILEDHHLVANQYVAIGDSRAKVVQSQAGLPNLKGVQEEGDGTCRLSIKKYPTRRKLGAVYTPFLDAVEGYFLASGELPPVDQLPKQQLVDYLNKEYTPITFESELCWPDTVGL